MNSSRVAKRPFLKFAVNEFRYIRTAKWRILTFDESIKFNVYLFLRVHTARGLGLDDYVRKPYIKEKLGLAARKELDRST